MKPGVKVCGVTDPEFAADAARLGVDYIGVIFAASSPRRVGLDRARQIAAAARAARPIPPRIVGVFSGCPAGAVAAVAAAVPLDVVQLHGAYGDDAVAVLRGEGLEVWRLFAADGRAPSADGPGRIPEDAVLVDGRDGCRTGGTGCLADWALVEELKGNGLRVVLAGGLSAANALEAASTNADILDFNSSLETSPGVKSLAKLENVLARLSS